MSFTREDAKALWDQVRANSATLEACPRHDFGEHVPMQKRYTCKHCGGWADFVAVLWYERGLRHGAPSKAPA